MDRQALQGWQADPFGLHESRYFSAGRPTKLVRDNGLEAYDEPPAPDFAAAAAASAQGAGVADGDTGEVGCATDATADSATALRVQPSVADDGLLSADLGTPRPAVAPVRRRMVLVAAVAMTAVAAVVVFVAIFGLTSHSRSQPVDLAALVRASAKAALARQTADVALTATTKINGSLVQLRGKGQVDLAANALAFNLSATYPGTTLAESEIMTGRALYIEVNVNGQSLAQYLGGKHWLGIPVAASGIPNADPQASPAWSLRLLEQQGARVVSTGSRSVGGLSCGGFAVTPSRQALLAAAQQEWAELGLPSSERAMARLMLTESAPPTISVWLDPTRQLVCELDIATQVWAGTSVGSRTTLKIANLQMVLTFTHYGVPVDTRPPAASDTFSALNSGGTFSVQPAEGQS